MDLTSILNYAVRLLTGYNKQSGSDGADHIDLATLRGLGPDQTFVLVNGKRRHQTAFCCCFLAQEAAVIPAPTLGYSCLCN